MFNKDLSGTLSLMRSGQLVADVVLTFCLATTPRNLLFIFYIFIYTFNLVHNFCKKIVLCTKNSINLRTW